MSADRITWCPKCQTKQDEDEGPQFREYASIGFEDGIFEVDYEGACGICGFKYVAELGRRTRLK